MASIGKVKNKNGNRTYEIRVYRGRDPLTKKQLTPYRKRVTPPETLGVKRTQTWLEREAAAFEAECKAGNVKTKHEQIQEMIDTQLAEAAEPTFNDYAKVFLASVHCSFAQRTFEVYDLNLRKASQTFGDCRMSAITPLMVKSFFLDYQTNGVNLLTGKKSISQGTINNLWKTLHRFFAAAVEDQIIPLSPMTSLKKPQTRKSTTDSTKVKTFSAPEISRFFSCLREEDLMWQAFCIFMVDTGCRRGEVVALEWSDIDFLTGIVTISKNAQYSPEKGEYTTSPKSGLAREIHMTEYAQSIMMNWKEQQHHRRSLLGLAPSPFCFNSQNGDRMRSNAPTVFFRSFGRKNGFESCHPHMLRHTSATLAIANGADVVSVSKRLGHSTPTITLSVYAHANEEAQKRTRNILAKALYETENQDNQVESSDEIFIEDDPSDEIT